MKKIVPLVFFLSAGMLLGPPARAEHVLDSQLTSIYDHYATDPQGVCRQLENTLQSADESFLASEGSKKAHYFLANCLYQMKELEQALVHYKKVSEIDPDDHQPLLDAGSVLLEQGRYSDARRMYEEALLRAKGNETAEARTREMIRRVPGKLQARYTFTTGIGYDSNVNSGPEDATHLIYEAFSYTLEKDEKPLDDYYFYNSLSAVLSKAFDPETGVFVNAGANHSGYFTENEYDTSKFWTAAGYKKIFGEKSITVGPFVNYQTFDDASYQIISGFNATGSARVSEKFSVWPYLGWYAQSFFSDKLRDAFGGTVGSSVGYQVWDHTTLYGSVYYSHNNAENDRYTYNNVFLGAGVTQKILKRLKATLGYNIQFFDYDDIDPVFGTAREDTGHKVYLNLDYSLDDILKEKDSYLRFSVSYHDNNSNHSFQERRRVFSAITFTIAF